MCRGTDIKVDETKNPDQCGEKGQRDFDVYFDGKTPNY